MVALVIAVLEVVGLQWCISEAQLFLVCCRLLLQGQLQRLPSVPRLEHGKKGWKLLRSKTKLAKGDSASLLACSLSPPSACIKHVHSFAS